MQNIDINNIVRSVAIALVGVPLSLSVSGLVNASSDGLRSVQDESPAASVREEYAGQIAKACYEFAFSKVDSKLEREAKTAIDEVFGGEVDYGQVCKVFVF